MRLLVFEARTNIRACHDEERLRKFRKFVLDQYSYYEHEFCNYFLSKPGG
jgi:hypothetical protein